MRPGRVTHVLFDFFGTLVDYSAALDGTKYAADCARLVRSYGGGVDAAGFAAGWDEAYWQFENRARADRREFSMDELSLAFLAGVLDRDATPAQARELATTYVQQWNDGVVYRPDTRDVLDALSRQYRLAVVSNTHEADLVPAHIEAMGIDDYFEAVLTSVEFGWRKPHPAIYAEALDRLGIEASEAVFVGDTYDADFVGPSEAGIRAYLIDPVGAFDVPPDQRLDSLADLPARLLR
ncbi:MAG TPA: HAD family hydrolase [Micromonosporaceae bacterium]